MYFFGLSKEEVLSQKHVVSYKETFKKNPINMVTLFGKQVYPVKSESGTKSGDGYTTINSPKLLVKDINLQLPADHYYAYKNFPETLGSGKVGASRNTVDLGFHSVFEANKAKEAPATNWSGKRNPNIVIDLEEPPTTEQADSVSYVTVRDCETKPSFLTDRISSDIVKADQSLVENNSNKATNMESGLFDLNSIPADELVSERHYCFLQDLNCPYIEETETSCEKSGIDDGPTPLSSPKCQNIHEKEGTASPASYTSCCTTENNSRTESRRGSSPRALDPSCRTRLEFPATEVLPENRCCNEEEEFSEIIQMAAESLVHISAVSYQNQDLQSKPVSRTNSSSQDQDFPDKPEMGNAAEPRCCSCDSYELHTLGISETNTEEDFCVSSMALDELNNITRDNNKEIGLKLRRGRRMKNFQKEILPSLSSLSRHEIREDLNILEAVLRSREYKKMQGKTKDVKFGANPRNKRSASQRYVGKGRRKNE
ncbi:hypothetical protein EUTSA_v10007497mg [Eutrema salsugineum]|uniref:Uncharacterized protein n=1 Tax=Eutrema salsugineum TaxID=72664 RepID=V4MUH9_EUTSA|nr:uncharacterized protein LOC18993655 [Eutrema salsugineum]ESQ35616.1 hypothetical protein EUTSA_v10007497mg [Eutrema salsugineum]